MLEFGHKIVSAMTVSIEPTENFFFDFFEIFKLNSCFVHKLLQKPLFSDNKYLQMPYKACSIAFDGLNNFHKQ